MSGDKPLHGLGMVSSQQQWTYWADTTSDQCCRDKSHVIISTLLLNFLYAAGCRKSQGRKRSFLVVRLSRLSPFADPRDGSGMTNGPPYLVDISGKYVGAGLAPAQLEESS